MFYFMVILCKAYIKEYLKKSESQIRISYTWNQIFIYPICILRSKDKSGSLPLNGLIAFPASFRHYWQYGLESLL